MDRLSAFQAAKAAAVVRSSATRTSQRLQSKVEASHDGVPVELEVEEGSGGERPLSVKAVLQSPRLNSSLVPAFGAAVRRPLPPVGRLHWSPSALGSPLVLLLGLGLPLFGPQLGLGGEPVPQRADEGDGHEEPVRGQTQLGLGRHVVAMARQLVYGEPLDVPDLLAGLGVELGVPGDPRDDVEAHQLVCDLLLDVALFADAVLDVEAGLLQHLAHRAVVRRLVLVHLALGETPARLGQVALHQQGALQLLVQDDGPVCGHPHLVLLPLLQDLLHVLTVWQQEGAVLEHGLGEVPDPAVGGSGGVLHAEVQVEPVGQLDLEAHPDGVVPLLAGDVQDEAAAQVVQHLGRDLGPFGFHAGRTNPDRVCRSGSSRRGPQALVWSWLHGDHQLLQQQQTTGRFIFFFF